jgi:hypothetical protein
VEDGDGGRDGLAGVVIEGEVVSVNCLLLEPAIGKIKKNRKQAWQSPGQCDQLVVPDSLNSLVVAGSAYNMAMGSA